MSKLYSGRGLTVLSGTGAELVDSDGKSYIDFMMGHGSSLFGHCHPSLVSAAKSASVSPWSVGLGIASSPRDVFLSILKGLLPDGKAFLCNSGTESIEAAMKLVLAKSSRKKIVALRKAFHGRSMGALSLTFNPRYKKPWQSCLYPVQHVSHEEVLDSIGDDTAALFIEPVQGEGGVYPLDLELGKAISVKCKEKGVLLVSDEIQSGWGRCGSVLASPLVGLDPDIVCLAKGVAGGLPIGAVLWKGSVGDFPPGGHGTTYGGNPFVSAVALASWRLLEDKHYPLQADTKGLKFRQGLKAIGSPLISEVRGMGLLIGVEMTIRSVDVVKALQEKGVLALPAGPKVVRFLPPFVAEDRHFKEVLKVFKEVCHELE